MPDDAGNITAGTDSVMAPGITPVFPADAPVVGGVPSMPNVPSNAPQVGAAPSGPARPTQQPSFFRSLLFSLGKGLIEGTKAGLQAERSPQGPAQAARIAINAPQQQREQMTTNKLADMNVAMTQLKLHQLQAMVLQEDEDRQNAAYNKGADTAAALVEKGKVDVLATGDLKSVQSEFQRRMADAKEGDQGLLPLQILPAPGTSAKDPQYALIMVGKDRLTDNWDEEWGATELGIDPKDFDSAGLTKFKFHASQGMDQQKALQLHASQFQNWWTKSTQALSSMKRTQETEAGKTKRAAAANDVRMKIAELNNITRRAIADQKAAQDQGDKLKISALGKLVQAAKSFGDAQGKIGNKAWGELTSSETQELTTKRRALDEAKKTWDQISAKTAPQTQAPSKPIPRGLLSQYLQKAGGDVNRAKQLAKADGYNPDTVQ